MKRIIVLMIYVFIARMFYKVYQVLPIHLLEMIFGVGLCFFGGHRAQKPL